MAEMKKVATRDSYGNALKELGAEFDNLVVLDADLAGATKTAIFQKAFPERHFDCGIAEANMICVAPVCPPPVWCPSLPPSPCLRPAALLSRSATPSAIPT